MKSGGEKKPKKRLINYADFPATNSSPRWRQRNLQELRKKKWKQVVEFRPPQHRCKKSLPLEVHKGTEGLNTQGEGVPSLSIQNLQKQQVICSELPL